MMLPRIRPKTVVDWHMKSIPGAAVAGALVFLILLAGLPMRAFGFGQPATIPPKLKKELGDRVWDEAQYYMAAEQKKQEDKQTYVDLQPMFEYLPSRTPNGALVVSIKLGGVQYNAGESGSSKGAATGTMKYLVFTYELKHGRWVEIRKPKWESQHMGRRAASELTEHIRQADQERAALKAKQEREAAEKRKAALAAALKKKYGDKNGSVSTGPVTYPEPGPQSKQP